MFLKMGKAQGMLWAVDISEFYITFFCRGGVVYMFGDKANRLPERVIPLRGNGCRRIPYAHRPHTFEILLDPQRSFQFAAADEYEASDWLQAFIQAASGVSMNPTELWYSVS
jgi:PH domain.